MPQFLTGDELGNIKSFKYDPSSTAVTVTTLHDGSGKGKERAVQNLAIPTSAGGPFNLVAVARSDGSASISRLQAHGIETVHEWSEPRLKAGQRYVGLAASSAGVYSCTSNGALRLTTLGDPASEPAPSQTAVLPTRLCEWRLAPDGTTFSYGGDEVELSVWDVESAFAPNQQQRSQPQRQLASPKKRKRGGELLPGELWRAKNVANDSLSLRQPVHNTCLAYLSPASQHLLAGTQRGDVRRYDTRAARKPVAEWKQIVPAAGSNINSGIGGVEKGFHEYEVFVSDQTSNLFAIDTRQGRVIYSYKGVAGAVTSMSPHPAGLLISTARDRYARVHSTCPPPPEAGQPQDDKGTVLEKVYMKSIPNCVVWDGVADGDAKIEDDGHGLGTRRGEDDGGGDDGDDDDDDEDDEDVWEGMQVVEDSDDESKPQQARRRRTQRK